MRYREEQNECGTRSSETKDGVRKVCECAFNVLACLPYALGKAGRQAHAGQAGSHSAGFAPDLHDVSVLA